MTARLTLSCDGRWPGPPPMPCRGAISYSTGQIAAATAVDVDPDYLVDVDAAGDLAEAAGWSSSRTGGAIRDYCPAHTARRAARVLELDPRWSGHHAAARSAVLELVEADAAAAAAGETPCMPDRAQLATLGIDPAAFEAGVRLTGMRMTDTGIEATAVVLGDTPWPDLLVAGDPPSIRKAGR